jgi:hypothetical protein
MSWCQTFTRRAEQALRRHVGRCLVVYDISNDAIRGKVADDCLDYGLSRIQPSAFQATSHAPTNTSYSRRRGTDSDRCRHTSLTDMARMRLQ